MAAAAAAATRTKELPSGKRVFREGPSHLLTLTPFPRSPRRKEGRKRVRNNIHYFPELSVIRDRGCRSRS